MSPSSDALPPGTVRAATSSFERGTARVTSVASRTPGPHGVSRSRRARAGASLLLLLLGALGVTGCSAVTPIDVPSTLPNLTQQDFLSLRWALVRQNGVARAVGVAEYSRGVHWDASLDLLGLDETGRVVSRSSAVVRPGFAPGPVAFQATLAETGREVGFQLRVVHIQQYSRPSR